MRQYLIDTNILIYYFNGSLPIEVKNKVEQILEAYPRLTPEAIRAAIAFAAEALRADVVYPVLEAA